MLPFSIGLTIECIYDKSLITQKIYFGLFKINMQGSNHFIVIIVLLNKKKTVKYILDIYMYMYLFPLVLCMYIYILLLINGQYERVKQVISLETWFLKFWYEFLTWFS